MTQIRLNNHNHVLGRKKQICTSVLMYDCCISKIQISMQIDENGLVMNSCYNSAAVHSLLLVASEVHVPLLG